MGYFQKPFAEITAEDIRKLVTDQVSEGSDLEFKRDASERGKTAKAIVAFATAEGGTVILGIDEVREEGRPNRAGAIEPIAACEEEADRLARSMRELIEPPLGMLRVRGIATEADGSGVVIVDVPRDRRHLHRVTTDLRCVIRSGVENRPLDMREINELVLAFANEPARIDRRLAVLRDRAEKRAAPLFQRPQYSTTVVALAATPIDPLYIEKIAYQRGLDTVAVVGHYSVARPGAAQAARYALSGTHWSGGGRRRPAVRGASYEYSLDENTRLLDEISEDGSAVLSLTVAARDAGLAPERPHEIYELWMVEIVAATLLTIDRLRRAAGAADAEYALDLHLWSHGDVFLTVGDGLRRFRQRIEPNSTFPRYSVGPGDEFSRLLQAIMTDVLHAAGFEADLEWGLSLSQR